MKSQVALPSPKKPGASNSRISTFSHPTSASSARNVYAAKPSNSNNILPPPFALKSSPRSALHSNTASSKFKSNGVPTSDLSSKSKTIEPSQPNFLPPTPTPLTENDIDFLPEPEILDIQYSPEFYYTPVELPEYIENETYFREERLDQLAQMNNHYHESTTEEKTVLSKGKCFLLKFFIWIFELTLLFRILFDAS